jgi:hypothetical protein
MKTKKSWDEQYAEFLLRLDEYVLSKSRLRPKAEEKAALPKEKAERRWGTVQVLDGGSR